MKRRLQTVSVILLIGACGNLLSAATVSYLQPPLAGGNGYLSKLSGNQRADNFSFAQKTKVTTVRWWGTYLNNPPAATDPFTVRFFAPDPLAGGVPQQTPTNQFTSPALTHTNSGLVDYFGDPIYRYEAPLSTPVIFSAGATAYVSVVNGSSNPWFWQKNTNAGTNWFRLDEQPENIWFAATGSENVGNLAFELIGVTSPPGDYDADFDVDQTDYNIWRSSFGSTSPPLAADGNANSAIDAADYVLWRNNIGAGAGGSGAAIVAPEPSSCYLTLSVSLALGLAVRYRQRQTRRGQLAVGKFAST